MNARPFTIPGVAAGLCLLGFAGGMLFRAASIQSSDNANAGLTKAIEQERKWLELEQNREDSSAVDDAFAHVSLDEMARCLKTRAVISHTTGLIIKPDVALGISPKARKAVNGAILAALGRIAAKEKASMELLKRSDLFSRYLIPSNKQTVAEELNQLGRTVATLLTGEVAAGFMQALRGTKAFNSSSEENMVTVSAGDSSMPGGPLDGSSGSDEEARALRLRWGHLVHRGTGTEAQDIEKRGEMRYKEIYQDMPLKILQMR